MERTITITITEVDDGLDLHIQALAVSSEVQGRLTIPCIIGSYGALKYPKDMRRLALEQLARQIFIALEEKAARLNSTL